MEGACIVLLYEAKGEKEESPNFIGINLLNIKWKIFLRVITKRRMTSTEKQWMMNMVPFTRRGDEGSGEV